MEDELRQMILDGGHQVAATYKLKSFSASATDLLTSIEFTDTGNQRIRTREITFFTEDLDGETMEAETPITIDTVSYWVDSVSPSVDGFSQIVNVRAKT